jgi:hypothetical protein
VKRDNVYSSSATLFIGVTLLLPDGEQGGKFKIR